MKMLFVTAVLIVAACIFESCDNDQRSSNSELEKGDGSLEAVGSEYCEVHHRECEIEGFAVVNISYPRSYFEIRNSEEYRNSRLRLFPNAVNTPFAVPRILHAHKERGKKHRRYYCPACREAEGSWLSQQKTNKKQNKAEEPTPNPPSD